MRQFLAGIDGGGSVTRVLLLDVDGKRCGRGVAGASNYDDVGYAVARDHIGQAIAAAWAALGMAKRPVDAVFLGMAGVVAAADRRQIIAMASELKIAPPERIYVDHDIRIALAGALSGRPGIVLIAGTGSSGYGRNANGQDWRSGGWGGLLADEGGAYQLGRQALIAVVQAYDGRGAPTVLSDSLLSRLGISDVEMIMHRLYVQGISRTEIAALAPAVTAAAALADAVATNILRQGAADLALLAATIAGKLGLERGEVAVTGSTVHKAPIYKEFVYNALRDSLPAATVTEPELPAVAGALWLAADQVGTLPRWALNLIGD